MATKLSTTSLNVQVETYGETHGLTVGMCGDGANDCGALKVRSRVKISMKNREKAY